MPSLRCFSVRRALFVFPVLLALFFAACSDFGPDDELGSSSSVRSEQSTSAPSSESSPSSFSEAAPGAELTIAFFNAEYFGDISYRPQAPTHAAVAEFIAANAIDIIVFSEIRTAHAELLRQELAARNVSMMYEITEVNSPYHDIAIFSRFNITHAGPAAGAAWFEGGQLVYALAARVDVGGEDIWFYGMHLKANGWAHEDWERESDIACRITQAEILQDFVRANHNLTAENIVICGDMNTTFTRDFEADGTLGYLTFKSDDDPSNDFTSVNALYLPMPGGYTWEWWDEVPDPDYAPLSPAMLDHIILSPALYAHYVPDSVDILLKNAPPRLSDHYPIVCKIALAGAE